MAWPLRPKRPTSHGTHDPSVEVPPEIPAGLRVYAVGDVHGRADLLAAAFAAIDADLARRPVAETEEVLLGDLVDRGPGSKGVIELVLARRRRRHIVALRGNHEEMLLAALESPAGLSPWLRNGGGATLRSYGIDTAAQGEEALFACLTEAVPADHRAFLDAMPDHHRCGDYLFVHAGLRPGVPLEDQAARDLRWIREPFLGAQANHGAIVVHGHTPVATLDVRPNRINLDTGAFATGLLTCLVLEERSIRYMEIRRPAAAPAA